MKCNPVIKFHLIIKRIKNMFLLSTIAVSALLLPTFTNAICSNIVKYSRCTSDASYKMASCNSLVQSVPTFEYWSCVCKHQTEVLDCSQICSDDAEMMQQYLSEKRQTSGTCQYVQELKEQGLDAPEVDNSATKTVNLGNSSVKLVAPQKTLPPMPSSNSTRRSSSFADYNSFAAQSASSITFALSAAFVFVLFL